MLRADSVFDDGTAHETAALLRENPREYGWAGSRKKIKRNARRARSRAAFFRALGILDTTGRMASAIEKRLHWSDEEWAKAVRSIRQWWTCYAVLSGLVPVSLWKPESADLCAALMGAEHSPESYAAFSGLFVAQTSTRAVEVAVPEGVELSSGRIVGWNGEGHVRSFGAAASLTDRQLSRAMADAIGVVFAGGAVPEWVCESRDIVLRELAGKGGGSPQLFTEYGSFDLTSVIDMRGLIVRPGDEADPGFEGNLQNCAALRLFQGLLAYVEAFPEKLVELQTGGRECSIAEPDALRKARAAGVSVRRAHWRAPHLRTLRHERYARNPDGSPRRIPVALALISGRKTKTSGFEVAA